MKTLHQVSIEGFKSIAQASITLGDLNVVIGANGAGKSNLIAAFRLLESSLNGRLQHYTAIQGGADRLLHHGRKATPTCRMSFTGADFSYCLTLEPNVKNRFVVAEEFLEYQEQSKTIAPASDEADLAGLEHDLLVVYDEDGNWVEPPSVDFHELLNSTLGDLPDLPSTQLESIRAFHFHDTSDAAPCRQDAEIRDARELHAEGRNLPAFLYRLREKHAPIYRRIVEHIRLVAPFFDDFILAPSPENDRMIRLEWRHRDSDGYFDAHSLSDGTLRFICLATLLLQPNPPRLILLDEPELGLHPLAIHILAEMLDAAAERTQILLATQSVTLLDQFSLDRVIVADCQARSTRFVRLAPQDFEAWLEHFSVGELWQKNVLGGRP